MRVEVLAVPDCPNRLPTLDLVRRVMRDLNVEADVVEVVVEDDAQARADMFYGSPTVRVDGVDVCVPEPHAQVGLSCRIYRDGGRLSGTPPRRSIETLVARRAKLGERTDR